ncbi:hypothetical protein UR08_12375, partial [Listeria kieliensis]
ASLFTSFVLEIALDFLPCELIGETYCFIAFSSSFCSVFKGHLVAKTSFILKVNSFFATFKSYHSNADLSTIF